MPSLNVYTWYIKLVSESQDSYPVTNIAHEELKREYSE